MVDLHGPQHRPGGRRPEGPRRARQHADLVPERQRGLCRVGPVRLRRQQRPEERPAHGRRSRSDGRRRRATSATAAAGPTPATRRCGCTSTTATRAASARRSSSTGRTGFAAQGGVPRPAGPLHRCDGDLRGTRPRRSIPTTFKGHAITPMEGTSLMPAFANQPLSRDLLAWEHERNRAIRVGQWKLVAQGRRGVGTVRHRGRPGGDDQPGGEACRRR